MYKGIIVTCQDENVHPPPTSAINWINIHRLLKTTTKQSQYIAPNTCTDQDEVAFIWGISERHSKSDCFVLGSYSWGFKYKLAATRASSFISTPLPLHEYIILLLLLSSDNVQRVSIAKNDYCGNMSRPYQPSDIVHSYLWVTGRVCSLDERYLACIGG